MQFVIEHAFANLSNKCSMSRKQSNRCLAANSCSIRLVGSESVETSRKESRCSRNVSSRCSNTYVRRSRSGLSPLPVREIGEAVGLSSPSTVHSHLSALVSAGAIKDPTKPRAIMIVDEEAATARAQDDRVRDIPVLGRIAAGTPILAAEHVEEVLPLPVDLVGNDPVFLLEVKAIR